MALRKPLLTALLAATCVGAWGLGTQAGAPLEIHLSAQNSPYTLKKIDCAAAGASGLHVSGLVQLSYPGEDIPGNVPTIEINCDNVTFDGGAKITSLSSVVLNARNVRGSIVVQTLSRSDGRSGNVTTHIQSGGKTVSTRAHRPQGGVDSDLNEDVDGDAAGAQATQHPVEVESSVRGRSQSSPAVRGSDGASGTSTTTVIDIPGLSAPRNSDGGQ
jgi:hypothetical protein